MITRRSFFAAVAGVLAAGRVIPSRVRRFIQPSDHSVPPVEIESVYEMCLRREREARHAISSELAREAEKALDRAHRGILDAYPLSLARYEVFTDEIEALGPYSRRSHEKSTGWTA